MSATVGDVVRSAARELERAGWPPDDARRDAETLARAALGCDLAGWIVRQREPAAGPWRDRFQSFVARRLRREPVAYIVGFREFYGRPFRVTPDVLIPRPETELVVEEALARLAAARAEGREPIDIADIGTGSGCLAVTLALEWPTARVIATEVSAAALAVAADNARRLGASNVRFLQAPLAAGARDAFDLIVANPPYVSERDRPHLMADVRDFEPALALFGGKDGLAVIRDLLPAADQALRPGGSLVMEIGAGQSDAVKAILRSRTGLTLLHIAPDLAGIPRVLVARKPKTENSKLET